MIYATLLDVTDLALEVAGVDLHAANLVADAAHFMAESKLDCAEVSLRIAERVLRKRCTNAGELLADAVVALTVLEEQIPAPLDLEPEREWSQEACS